MDNHTNLAIKGIYEEYVGKRHQLQADLNILLDYPQGVGDHAVHSKDIKEKLIVLEQITSMIDLIKAQYGDKLVD